MPWIFHTLEIKFITECFLGSRWQNRLDIQKVITYINSEAASRLIQKNSYCFPNKRLDVFVKYLFRLILLRCFCCVEGISYCHLYYSCQKNHFYYSEVVIRRCWERYSFKVIAEPAKRDKNHFNIDIGRGVHWYLLPTKLS